MSGAINTSGIQWPEKARELNSVLFDSTRWNGFRFRDDDIVVVTWSKTGTTLTQQLVFQLIFAGKRGLYGEPGGGLSPWLDGPAPFPEMLVQLEAQRHRRCIKSHLPRDALLIDPRVRYLYVGRDARDVIWSVFNHHLGFTQEARDLMNGAPDRGGPPILPIDRDVRDYYLHWLDHDALPGFPMPSFWDHVRGWWEVRGLPNVLLLHFNDLINDLERQLRRVAHFLGIHIDEARLPAMLEHCSLEYMREAVSKDSAVNRIFKDGPRTFFNRGTNGRWRDVLSADEIARCDEISAARLPPDCAHWLLTGELN